MVPPGDIFGIIPVWVGVYLALILTQALAGWLAYKRVIHLIRQGRSVARFDRPWERLTGAISIVVGQRKVLQRVGSLDARSRSLDLAGLGHAFVFWGFLSFSLSYLIFIFIGSIWHSFPRNPAYHHRGQDLQHLSGLLRRPDSGSAGLDVRPAVGRQALPPQL